MKAVESTAIDVEPDAESEGADEEPENDIIEADEDALDVDTEGYTTSIGDEDAVDIVSDHD